MATMIDVHSPVKGFTGTSVGVAFTDGHAQVEEGSPAYNYFKRRGYHLGSAVQQDSDAQEGAPVIINDHQVDGAVEGPNPPEDEVQEIDIPGMPGKDATRGELADFAEGMGIDTESLTKAQIVAKIKAEATKQ